jgi:hypothetical protein
MGSLSSRPAGSPGSAEKKGKIVQGLAAMKVRGLERPEAGWIKLAIIDRAVSCHDKRAD